MLVVMPFDLSFAADATPAAADLTPEDAQLLDAASALLDKLPAEVRAACDVSIAGHANPKHEEGWATTWLDVKLRTRAVVEAEPEPVPTSSPAEVTAVEGAPIISGDPGATKPDEVPDPVDQNGSLS